MQEQAEGGLRGADDPNEWSDGRRFHGRMPVVLEESHIDQWLDAKNPERALGWLLRPAPNEWLVAERASPLVNSVKNELLAVLTD